MPGRGRSTWTRGSSREVKKFETSIIETCIVTQDIHGYDWLHSLVDDIGCKIARGGPRLTDTQCPAGCELRRKYFSMLDASATN